MMHINTSHDFSENGYYFMEEMTSGFPLMSYNCSAFTLWFTEVPESNM